MFPGTDAHKVPATANRPALVTHHGLRERELLFDRDRRVADAVALSLSLFSPVNAAFFPIVRTGISNTLGAQTYRESLAAVRVLEQIASIVGSEVMSWCWKHQTC